MEEHTSRHDQPGEPADPLPPPPPPGPKRVVRRRDDRMVGGIASGIAAYFDIDPSLVRLAFIILTFVGGLGVALYAAAYLILPEADTPHSPPTGNASRRPKTAMQWTAVGLIVLAVLIMSDGFHGSPLIWGLLIAGAGVYLLRNDDLPLLSSSSSKSKESKEGLASDGEATATPPSITTPAYGATHVAPPAPRKKREHSALGLLGVGVACVAVGIAVLSEAIAQSAFAVIFIVLGLTIFVGSWIGRARWLAFPALLLLPLLVVSSFSDFSTRGDIGSQTWKPLSAAQVQPVYEFGVGHLQLDLSQVRPEGTPVQIDADLGIGFLEILVPPDVTVIAHAEADLGQVEVFGAADDGNSATLDRRHEVQISTSPNGVVGSPGGTISLNATVDMGRILITDDPSVIVKTDDRLSHRPENFNPHLPFSPQVVTESKESSR